MSDPVSAMKLRYKNKIAHAMIDFLYDVMACTHDKRIAEMLKTTAIKDVRWLDVPGLEDLREIFRLLNLHRAVMETHHSDVPPGPVIQDSDPRQQ